jgi:hypothetical protein
MHGSIGDQETTATRIAATTPWSLRSSLMVVIEYFSTTSANANELRYRRCIEALPQEILPRDIKRQATLNGMRKANTLTWLVHYYSTLQNMIMTSRV